MTSSLPRVFLACSLILSGCFCGHAALFGSRDGRTSLSFEERVAYQTRLEQVYWRHRSATAGQPKLPFSEAMPDGVIRSKVEETLRKSTALTRWWQRPITAAQLQSEMTRMAAQTQQPKVLREIFAALDNDPLVIAECLARPLLVDRQLGSWYARDERFHGPLRRQIEAELQTKADAPLKDLSGQYFEHQIGKEHASKSRLESKMPALNGSEWQRTIKDLERTLAVKSDAPLPVGRNSSLQESETEFYVVTVLDQNEEQLMLGTATWPKESFDAWWQRVKQDLPLAEQAAVAQGSYQLPKIAAAAGADDTWRATVTALSAREGHTAIWTGSEMIIWGGVYAPLHTQYIVTVGGRYNPATDSWSLTTITNAPTWRRDHTSVWTGTEMIVWGGNSGVDGITNSGARYNPATNLWTPLTTNNAPGPRHRHVAVWTGSKMLIWGGLSDVIEDSALNSGGVFDPAANSWSAISTTNAPARRAWHTAVWSGTEMIVWGGHNGQTNSTANTGGRYNPQSNTWQAVATTGAPAPRLGHVAIWTGSRMVVWGGQNSIFASAYFNSGGIYYPATNTWSATNTSGAPTGRSAAVAVWSGSEMLLWGGDNANRLRNGGRFNPQSNIWQSMSTIGAPEGAVLTSAIWTGSEMIVWGGQEPTIASNVNTGARYNPQSNSWVPVTNPQNGGARSEHPAVWTGAEMIVWGSYTIGSSPTNTGARYFPSTDSWLPTSMVNVPGYRYSPEGVWTGTEMVVWGGCSDSFCFNRLNTGGRYNPASDSWQPISTLNAPEPRYWFTAVWSGAEMIVWGGCNAQTCGPGGNSDPDGLQNGGRYNPQTDTWQPTTTTGAPNSRWAPTAVWTGTEMIIWGGNSGAGQFNSGGRYNPQTDSWRPTSLTNAPTARMFHESVWTGSRMMVWGGYNSILDEDMNTGGLYDPASDSWFPTSLANAPSPRGVQSMIWTGEEAIVWSGTSGPNNQEATSTGGRYNPQRHTWRPTSTLEAPSPRGVHSAVWTGSEMIVFGGESCARCEPVLDTGGRYSVIVAPRELKLTAIRRQLDGKVVLQGFGLPNSGYILERSLNRPVGENFTFLTEVTTDAIGNFTYTDVSVGGQPIVFYRAVAP